jgi:hypothetical protein
MRKICGIPRFIRASRISKVRRVRKMKKISKDRRLCRTHTREIQGVRGCGHGGCVWFAGFRGGHVCECCEDGAGDGGA